jgi:hypothetical protein
MGEESWKASVRESFKTWKQDSTRRAIRQYFNSVQVSINDNASVYWLLQRQKQLNTHRRFTKSKSY